MNNSSSSEQATAQNSALQAALQRAEQVNNKLKVGPFTGVKRPSSDELNSGPNIKKSNMEGSTEQIAVPDKMVGMIIGRGGEQITRLQQDSNCKIQMAPDSGGQNVRMCTLTGTDEAIAQAKSMIDGIIANGGVGAGGGVGGGGGGGMGGMGGMGGGQGGLFEVMVPGNKVGLIIGKGGETIKMLQEQTGAKVIIIQENSDHADQKPLRISGPPHAVEDAKARVMELLNQMEPNGFGGRGGGRGGRGMGMGMRGGSPRGGGFGGRGRGRGGWPSGHEGGGETVDYVTVSSDKVGLVIGKGGETIKSINQASGAYCEIDKRAPPDAVEKNFVIRGPPECVEKAKQMVLEKIGAAPASGYGSFPGQTFVPPGSGGGGGYNPSQAGGYNQPGAGYDPPSNPYQPQPPGPAINPATGQPDYSSQWADYYRSLGMVKEAELIEQQGGGAPQQAAPVVPAQAQQQQDYSAQWADYYRSIGKTKEAEAIEAQMRSKPGSAPGGFAPAAAPYPAQPGYPAAGGYFPPQSGYPGYD